MDKDIRIAHYASIITALSSFRAEDIEQAIICYSLDSAVGPAANGKTLEQIMGVLRQSGFATDIESIVEFFELMLDKDHISENGIVFTPKYISDYIVQQMFSDLQTWNNNFTVIDPGCGCGIFLVSAIEYLHRQFHIPMKTLIEENILGADIDPLNARRCRLVLKILAQRNGEQVDDIPHVKCMDSLREDWITSFGVNEITYVIGNPPYVNPHDMTNETAAFLRSTFTTTQSGAFNIFYAFIEHAMKYLAPHGVLGFIIPNNFLTIKSAAVLREHLQRNNMLRSMIDLGPNMIFSPVRTYNCIIMLDRQNRSSFHYAIAESASCIRQALDDAHFQSMSTRELDKHGWRLVDEQTRNNLRLIESNPISIKSFIRTGIATLRDGLYITEHDESGFYKRVNNEKLYIEPDLIKPLYKVSDLKRDESIASARLPIIFPYMRTPSGYAIIPEETMMERYPLTYAYLLTQREELDKRDKGKENPQGWYAYGRTQGLNKYGKKLLYPTFSNHPKFIYVEDEDSLFCNGFAVFENDIYDLPFLQKVLNSFVMDYYVSNTSYAIEGGYYCYQKKFVERFSLPEFTDAEIAYINGHSAPEIDDFLIRKYGLTLS